MKKNINKSIIYFVTICLCLSFSLLLFIQYADIGAQAAESKELLKTKSSLDSLFVSQMNKEYNASSSIKCTKKLKDFAGNEYTLIECSPTGYLIYCDDASTLSEYSASSPSPYLGYNKNLYYGGAGQFYAQKVNGFVHTITGEVISSQTRTAFSSKSESLYNKFIANKDTSLSSIGTSGANVIKSSSQTIGGKTYTCVNNSSFFVNLDNATKMGYVHGGYCGYVAGNILLGWYDTFISDNYVNNACMTARSLGVNRAYISAAITNELIGYGSGSSLSIYGIKNVMNSYFYAHNVGSSQIYVSPFFSGTTIKNSIDDNRPVILVGSIYNPQTGKKQNHIIVAYGYIRDGYGWDIWGFLSHYGWPGYSAVSVNVNHNDVFSGMYRIN